MIQSKFFSKLRNVLDSAYPGRYSLKINKNYADAKDPLISLRLVDILGHKMSRTSFINVYESHRQFTNFKIRIYFPEIEITNSAEELHTIYDYVLTIEGSISRKNQITRLYLGGKSFSVNTFNGVNIRYMHSHQRPDEHRNFDNFCIGDTSLGNLISKISGKNINESTLEQAVTLMDMLFIEAEEFLKWESLEGGPYATLSTNVLKHSHKVGNYEVFMDMQKQMKEYLINKESNPFTVTAKGEIKMSKDFLHNYYKVKLGNIKGTDFRFFGISVDEFKKYLYEKADKNIHKTSFRQKAYNVGSLKIYPRHIKCEFDESDIEFTHLESIKPKLEKLFKHVYEQEILQSITVQNEEIPNINHSESSTFASFRRVV